MTSMSFAILRSRLVSLASKRNSRFLCSTATSAPPSASASPARWNFLKYAAVASLTGATAYTGYASYDEIAKLFSHLFGRVTFCNVDS